MIENLKKAFLRLRSANLKINLKNCTLFGRDVKYFEHIVSEKGITTDSEKIIAVRDWPIPQNNKSTVFSDSVLIIENLLKIFLLLQNLYIF